MDAHAVKFWASAAYHSNGSEAVIISSRENLPGQSEEPLPIAIILIAVIGLLSNSFTLIVISSARNFTKKHSGVFIYHQTVIDLLTSAVLLVTQSTVVAAVGPRGFLGEVFCRLFRSHSLMWICLRGSTLNLVNLSLERYLQIVVPIYHRQHFNKAKTVCLLVLTWVLAIALNVHLFLTCFNDEGQCNFKDSMMNQPTVQLVYGFVEFVTVYLIPLVVLTYFYGHMLFIIRKQAQKRDSQRSGPKQDSQKKNGLTFAQVNLVKTFILVAVLYMVCWTPTQLYCLLFGIKDVIGMKFSNPFKDLGYKTGVALAMFNVCVNPFIYAYKFEAFKKQTARLFSRLKSKNIASQGSEKETFV